MRHSFINLGSRYSQLFAHGLIVAIGWGLLLFDLEPETILISMATVSTFGFLALVIAEMRTSQRRITPLACYFLITGMSLGPASFHAGLQLSAQGKLPFANAVVGDDSVCAGYLLFLFGSFVFHAGLSVTRPKSEAPPQPMQDGNWHLIALWSAGIATRIFGGPLSVLGAIHSILCWGSVAALCTYCSRTRDKNLFTTTIVIACGVVVEFIVNLRFGSKAYIMLAFFPGVWLMLFQPRLRKFLLPTSVLLAVFYLNVVQPVVTASRLLADEYGETTTEKLVRVFLADEHLTKQESASQDFLERHYDALPVGFIHQEVERFGFQNGKTLEYLLYAFVPRALWPEKPFVTRGNWFSAYLGLSKSEGNARTSTGQSAVGEIYWNFGIFGIIGGMFLLGVLSGFQWRIAGPNPERSAFSMLLYIATAFLIPAIPDFGPALTSLVHSLLVLGLPVLIIERVNWSASRSFWSLVVGRTARRASSTVRS